LTKWEYFFVRTEKDKTVNLNDFGKQGWELVTITIILDEPNFQHYCYYFKRKKKFLGLF